ncbi:MAG: DUF1186 domain-containing protein [Prochlorotrichaceae cyanobacterium]|jgi:hypothetical protein
MSEKQVITLREKLINCQEECLSCGKPETWSNYVQDLGLTEEDIPELIDLATSDDDEMYDKRIFAWRALGQLKALSAVIPLISFLETVPLYDDWAYEEIPLVLSLMGPDAKPIVQDYITNNKNLLSVRISFSDYFRCLVCYHPQQRESVINFLVEQLAKPATSQDDRTLNGFFISDLCDLKAIEVAKEIEQAFVHQQVDLSVIGSWDEARVYLGLKPRTEIPLDRLIFSKKLDGQSLKKSQTKGFGDRSETKNSKSKKRKKR